MNPLDNRKYLKYLSKKLSTKASLTDEERKFLSTILSRIAYGEDANKVLGVQFGRGSSLADAKSRQVISFAIHWIECAIQPTDSELPGHGYSVTQACAEIAPILRKMLGEEYSEKYDTEYIRQCYYKPEYSHMRSVERGTFDMDSPFQP